MSDDRQITLDAWIRGYLDRVVNEREVDAVDELVSADYVGSGPGWPSNRQQLREFYVWQATYRPDWRIAVQATLDVGDWIAVRAFAGGTVAHDESGRLLERTHRRAVEWLTVFRVVDGILAETRFLDVRDRFGPHQRF